MVRVPIQLSGFQKPWERENDMTSGMMGADIDSALDLVTDNGGLGEFEAPEEDTTARWYFPRFTPVCADDGTQMVLAPQVEVEVTTGKGKNKKTEIELRDSEHEYLCPTCNKTADMDINDKYLSRSGIGYDTDVETVAAWLEAPRNIVGAVLLLGDPGTGKTALVEAAVTQLDRSLLTVLCTPDHTKDSLFLRFVGEGNGDAGTPFTLGPLAYAAKYGHVLYMDEVLLLQDGVKPVLYSLADGRRYLPEGNVDGSALEIHPDFRLILSSNPMVRGASLPEPLASRCASTTLTVETDGAMLRALGIDDAVVTAWEHLKNDNLWTPQVRELRLADYWLGVNNTQAVSAFLPEHCPEAQRTAVRNIATNYLGGDVRRDGRLVVA